MGFYQNTFLHLWNKKAICLLVGLLWWGISVGQNVEKIYFGTKIVGEIQYECFLQSDEKNYFNPFHQHEQGYVKLDFSNHTNGRAVIRISRIYFTANYKGGIVKIIKIYDGAGFGDHNLSLPISLKQDDKLDIILPVKKTSNSRKKSKMYIYYEVLNRNNSKIQGSKKLFEVRYSLKSSLKEENTIDEQKAFLDEIFKKIDRDENSETKSFKNAVKAAEKAAQETSISKRKEVITIYENYITNYHNTNSAKKARENIRSFCNNEYTRVYKAQNKWELKQFIDGFYVDCEKYGLYKDKATHAINEITKEGLTNASNPDYDYWQDAKKINTESAYRKYLKKSPRGKYVTNANRSINEIQSKDEKAISQLELNLKIASTNLQKQLEAYENYLALKPTGHFSRKRDAAKRESKRIAALIGAFFLTVDRVGNGKIKVEIHNNEMKGTNELDISFFRDGRKIPENEYVRSNIIARDGKFIFTVDEVEGDSNKIRVGAKNRLKEWDFIMPIRDEEIITRKESEQRGSSVSYNWSLRIRGGEGPFKLKYKKDNMGWSKPIALGNKRFIEDLATLIPIFDTHGKYTLNVSNYNNVLVGEKEVNIGGAIENWGMISGVLTGMFLVVFGWFFIRKKKRARGGIQQRIVQQVKESLDESTEKITIIKSPKIQTNKRTKIILGDKDIANAKVAHQEKIYPTCQFSSNTHYNIPIKEIEPSSSLRNIYFSMLGIQNLDEVLQQETDRIALTGNPKIIGGVLMGQYHQVSENQYEVVIENYVPIIDETDHCYIFSTHDSFQEKIKEIESANNSLHAVGYLVSQPDLSTFAERKPSDSLAEILLKHQFAMTVDTNETKMPFVMETNHKSSNQLSGEIKQNWQTIQDWLVVAN